MHTSYLTTRSTNSLYILSGKYTLLYNLGIFLALILLTDKIMSAKNVNKLTRISTMLKSYAVALVLATAAPVAIKSEETVQAPIKSQAVATTTSDTSKNGVKTGKNW